MKRPVFAQKGGWSQFLELFEIDLVHSLYTSQIIQSVPPLIPKKYAAGGGTHSQEEGVGKSVYGSTIAQP